MSRANPVAVRIIKQTNGKFLVKGRKTEEEHDTFDEAWEASKPYWRGEKW